MYWLKKVITNPTQVYTEYKYVRYVFGILTYSISISVGTFLIGTFKAHKISKEQPKQLCSYTPKNSVHKLWREKPKYSTEKLLPVTVIKIYFPPFKCNTKISSNLSRPLFILYADLLSTNTLNVISHFRPEKIMPC